MKKFKYSTVIFLALNLVLGLVNLAGADQYLAFSMRSAEKRLKESGAQDSQIKELGGFTRILGAVFDQDNDDLIIFGQRKEGNGKLCLDDLVTALRAVLVHQKMPVVSLEKTPKSLETGTQEVCFEGGIENTQFGQDFLEADIILKKFALGLLSTEVWGVPSYFALAVKRAQENSQAKVMNTRFWFFPVKRAVASEEGVIAVKELKVGVRAQLMNASVEGKKLSDSNLRNELADNFALALTNNYPDIASNYPKVARVNVLMESLALAYGIKELPKKPNLNYWTEQYKVSQVKTEKEYSLLKRAEKINSARGTLVYEIDGGIKCKVLISRLNDDGDISALKDLVIKSRPKKDQLIWAIPLEGWQLPTDSDAKGQWDETVATAQSKKVGCSVTDRLYPYGDVKKIDSDFRSIPFPGLTPNLESSNRLTPQRFSSNVGGVMLRGVAQAAGKDVRIDISRGNFSLVIDGENARLSPEAFRKFITALWSVYYVDQAPGISIDPIEPGGKKHLVRYIGKVVNTDLGRVMREADYIMKKWAVGTDKPAIAGFKDVDALSARHGLRYVGASRRFWFVPEAMRFKQGGGLLLFEDGHMTLKTEYRLQDKGAKAEPADEAFARFFTNHYPAIAAKYPVYQELFEYAKLVGLARYLKEQGVPLLWFLLANRDQVLVEDSPGTVDALAKGSKYFEGLHIEGGVDLGIKGQYVYDSEAVKAITAAGRKQAPQAHTPSTPVVSNAPPVSGEIPAQPVSFEVGRKNYTAVPQHALTSGRDRRGLRYQTDLALRQGSQPGLELVRYFNPWRQEAGEFGSGWHLLIPYQIKPVGEAKRKFLNAVIPEKMALWNLISGQQEILTFSTNRYSIAGYVPENLARSQVIGLFPLSDASYRLADKLGNEFWFDQAGFLTDMIFSKDHHIHLEYLRDLRDLLEYVAYQVKPADAERVDFLNVRLPKRMQVTDQRSGESQTLTFNGQGDKVGYASQDQAGRFRFLALMTNGSFRLLLKDGAEIPLDRSGVFSGKVSLPDHPLAKAISLGSQKITFAYTFGKTGNTLISQAIWHQGEKGVAPVCVAKYEYDDEGRLARVTGPQTGIAKAGTIPPIPVMLSQHRIKLNSQ